MAPFTLVFVGSVLLNLIVTFRASDYYRKWLGRAVDEKAAMDESKGDWEKLLRRYLFVYLLATLSDWLQGPYVYALYADYGYSQHDIAVLFVAGFGSSMVFGSFIGGMADWGGRRNFIGLFSITYAASCMTKHFKDFYILLLGRLLGGVATSLLFSVFEAWLIRSHSDAKLKHWLSKSFQWAAYCNSLIAIIAGLIANKAASSSPMRPIKDNYIYVGGYLNPFDIALVALVICGTAAMSLWEENYGDSQHGHNGWGLKSALVTTWRNTDILLCGIVSSLFEGSMYIFVFMWTPALTDGSDEGLPFGLIFSTFMVCCMAGSSLFSLFVDRGVEQLAVGIFAVAALSMALVAISSNHTIKFLALNLFEITVGMYFPTMGTMKGTIVPEGKRAAIYNLYRIPLNFIVLFSLLTDLTPVQSFWLNTVMLSTACGLQYILTLKRRELVYAKADSTESVGLVSSRDDASPSKDAAV